MLSYLKFPIFSLALGLALAGLLSWMQNHQWVAVLHSIIIVGALSILEISLSFDNAIVNAAVIQRMKPIWKKRFLLWGLLIAVFGMRFLLPLVIASLAGSLSPFETLKLAIYNPAHFSELLQAAHLAVSWFGGTFLILVALHFFLDSKKTVHFVPGLEFFLHCLARIPFAKYFILLVILIFVFIGLPESEKTVFLKFAMYGLFTYVAVHAVSEYLADEDHRWIKVLSAGLGLFIYLEVLDASLSLDGVIGAFAMTRQFHEMIIGLSIGAFFVRGLTVYLVDHQKLKQFKFLEHGAFYSLFALAFFMLFDSFFHFPEILVGSSGAVIILVAFFWSIHVDRKTRTR